MRAVDRSSPIPLYYQLQEILKQEIDHGRWKPGEMLPSDAEMTAHFGVSRSVTRKALDILEGDGQVYRVNGKGTFVAQPKFRYEAIGAATDWGAGHDVTPTLSKVVAIQRVSVGGHVGRLLGLNPAQTVFELTYVQSVEDRPASLTQMFLRPDATAELVSSELPELVEAGPEAVLQLRDRYGLHIAESQLSVEATRTNSFEADLLCIAPDSPVFLVGTLEMAVGDWPVAFSRTVVRSDHFRFTVVLRHPNEPTSLTLGSAIKPESVWPVTHASRVGLPTGE